MSGPLSKREVQERLQALLDAEGSMSAAADALTKAGHQVSRTTLTQWCHANALKAGDFRDHIAMAKKGFAPDFDLVHPSGPGLTLKGTSLRYNKNHEVEQYWNKTRQQGRDPEEVAKLPDPKRITKISTLYDQEGRVSQQWIAEKPEDEARELLWRAFAKELAAEMPRAEPTKGPGFTSDDLMAVYPVGDHHLGMLSWREETGADYDLQIGETLLNSAFDYLIDTTPPCEQALVVFLGDFLHYDGFESVTPANKNPLDSDSRFPKMVRTGVRSMRYGIERAAAKHQKVHVILEFGNHDPASTVFLMECLHNIYENDPRITIDTSPRHFHYFSFGNTLIGSHHGHDAKMPQLPLIMATDRPEEWGRSEYRYWYTGHTHHSKTQAATSAQDFSGCTVESFRVLPPADAWAAGKGYRSIRDMKSIVIHRELGEVARHIFNPAMLESAA